MAGFHYVYILVNDANPGSRYTGLTKNLEARLAAHNAGRVKHTARHRPWHVDIAVAFRSQAKAAAFETYLKSHSGRAFASKHF